MSDPIASDLVSRHYDSDDLGDHILAGLRAAGKDIDHLTPGDLAALDQFHIGGRGATLELMELAGIPRGARVLDAGGGIGGPARTLASERGCRVTVLDLSQTFCETGAMLTELTGFSDAVTFECGNALAMPFPDGSFEIVWTQHSSMNIDDKEGLYAELRRVLPVTGKLAIHEVVAGPESPVHFPVPWARGPGISFLRPAAEIRRLIAASGFRELAWRDVTAGAIAFWRDRLSSAPATPPPPGLNLLLGPEFQTMAVNTSRNLEEGRIEVVQAVFEAI